VFKRLKGECVDWFNLFVCYVVVSDDKGHMFTNREFVL
jgi:hypothetical protein